MTPYQETHYALLKHLKNFDFSAFERRVLDEVLDKSFGSGFEKAYFPRLEYFAVLTRVSKGNVSSTLKSLIRAKVIDDCGAGWYAVHMPTEQWLVAPRVQWTAALKDVDQWLRKAPEQLELTQGSGCPLGDPLSLSQALRELAGQGNFPAVCRGGTNQDRRNVDSRGVPGPAQGDGPSPGTGVPVSGTGVPVSGTGVPVSGTGERLKACESMAALVPDSGTPPSLRIDVKDVSSKERLTSKRPDQELEEQVRVFIGERDWRRYWQREEERSIFRDLLRAKVLDSSLRYCKACIKDGIAIRKTPGAMLWFHYKEFLSEELAKTSV